MSRTFARWVASGSTCRYTYWTALIGSLALIGFPAYSGFFSKDLLIEAVKESHWHGQGAIYWIAYLSVLLGVFVTALYSFRMFFLVFHGEERMDAETKSHLHETPCGGHRAVDPAGDSVGHYRLVYGRSGSVWELFRGCDLVDAGA